MTCGVGRWSWGRPESGVSPWKGENGKHPRLESALVCVMIPPFVRRLHVRSDRPHTNFALPPLQMSDTTFPELPVAEVHRYQRTIPRLSLHNISRVWLHLIH